MLTFASVLFRAKAIPCKKARVNNPSYDHVVIEPGPTTKTEGPNTEATFDERTLKIIMLMNKQKLIPLCKMINRQVRSGLMTGLLVQ